MALWQSRASPTLTPYLKLTSERASLQASERASRRDNMKKELIKFVIDHLKTFKSYPLEFEYKNKVYDYKTIMKTINNRKQQASEQKG
jgi:hypothetical protein